MPCGYFCSVQVFQVAAWNGFSKDSKQPHPASLVQVKRSACDSIWSILEHFVSLLPWPMKYWHGSTAIFLLSSFTNLAVRVTCRQQRIDLEGFFCHTHEHMLRSIHSYFRDQTADNEWPTMLHSSFDAASHTQTHKTAHQKEIRQKRSFLLLPPTTRREGFSFSLIKRRRFVFTADQVRSDLGSVHTVSPRLEQRQVSGSSGSRILLCFAAAPSSRRKSCEDHCRTDDLTETETALL